LPLYLRNEYIQADSIVALEDRQK